MNPRRLLVIGLCAVAVIALALVGLRSGGGGTTARAAPPLPRTALVGSAASGAALRGHVTVVNFWASWCHPCRKEAPELQRFQRELGGAKLVGIDTGDNRADARRFARRYGWRFPLLRDADGTVANRFHVAGLPTSFVLDTRGRIVKTLSGPQTAAQLRAAVGGVG